MQQMAKTIAPGRELGVQWERVGRVGITARGVFHVVFRSRKVWNAG